MILKSLQIQNLRNIKSVRLDLHPKLNLVSGPNGSGKTSFLEAIYLLSTGHSFRTREITPLISNNQDSLTVFAQTIDEQSVSIQKSISQSTQVRLNTVPCKSSSELAYFLPCQVFYQDLFQIIDAGPSVRRTLLDWGLFHVKQPYLSLWKSYARALKQRNALLRQKASPSSFTPWNKILAEQALQLDLLRQEYFQLLQPMFHSVLAKLTELQCSLIYYKGWDKRDSGKLLEEILNDSYQSDLSRQFTQYGAHQADLFIECDELKVKQYFSRGQQKLILFALKIAQSRLISRSCVFLCDDISSELDHCNLQKLIELISNTPGQFFITGLDASLISQYIEGSDYLQLTINNGQFIS